MQTILESGMIKKQTDLSYKTVAYWMKFLDENYLAQVMNLEKMIVNNLSDPELYEFVPIEFMKNQFRKEGRIIGVISEEKVVAFRVLHFPATAALAADAAENFGIDLNIPEDELDKVAHLEVTVVHPAYRGNSLALKMNRHAIKIAKNLNYSHLCVTVSPKNYANVITLFKMRFVIKELKEKYRGKLRYIFYQNLKNPIIITPHKKIVIKISDIHEQKEVLGQGFYGYKIRKNVDEFEIVYAK